MHALYKILTDLGDWVKLFGPVFAFFGLTWRYFLKKKYEEFKVDLQNLQKLTEYIPKIERIDFELKPNGGSSIRDAINRIESLVTVQDKKLLSLFQSMPFGTFITDEFGNWTQVNLMLCRISERTETELKGRNWMRCIEESDRANVILEWERSIKNEMIFDMETNYITPTEDLKAIRISASQIYNHKNQLVGYFGTVYELEMN